MSTYITRTNSRYEAKNSRRPTKYFDFLKTPFSGYSFLGSDRDTSTVHLLRNNFSSEHQSPRGLSRTELDVHSLLTNLAGGGRAGVPRLARGLQIADSTCVVPCSGPPKVRKSRTGFLFLGWLAAPAHFCFVHQLLATDEYRRHKRPKRFNFVCLFGTELFNPQEGFEAHLA